MQFTTARKLERPLVIRKTQLRVSTWKKSLAVFKQLLKEGKFSSRHYQIQRNLRFTEQLRINCDYVVLRNDNYWEIFFLST